MKRILFLFIIVLVSCRSLDSSQFTVDSLYSQRVSHADLSTINYQLSTARDSIVYRERTIHDTVFITKEVYRASQLSTVNSQLSTHSDTVIVTEWRDRIIEKPPERYIPRFYKISTAILYILIALIIVFIVIKIRLR